MKLAFFGSVLYLIGCASMPDAKVQYYLPKSSADITVNQTVSCIDTSNPVVETTVGFEEKYFANLNQTKSINFSDLDTFYSTGSAEISFSKDGRLESFNSTSTSAVSDIVTTTISFLDAFGVLGNIQPADQVQSACEKINQVAGQNNGKQLPLSITLKSNIQFLEERKFKSSPFRITGYPQSFYDKIVPAVGTLSYVIDVSVPTPAKPVNAPNKGDRAIILVEPLVIPVKVILTSSVNRESTEYYAKISVPQWGTEYSIPVPKPPIFGSNTLNLNLHPSGKIKTLKYGTTNGAKDLGTTINSISEVLAETDAEKAAALKAEADVLAQQQRLLKCKTIPEECK